MDVKEKTPVSGWRGYFAEARGDLKLETALFVFIWFACYSLGIVLVQLFSFILNLPDLAVLFKGLLKGEYLEYLNTLKCIQIIVHLFQYLIPAILFVYLLYPKKALKQLYADRLPSLENIALGFALVISIYPFISFVYYWNTQLLPDSAISQEKLDLQQVFLQMSSPLDFILNLILLGLVAGVGEELLFRGVLQKKLTLWAKNVHLGAFLTGAIFSLMHFQLEGFLPRFILGTLFCYLLIYGKSVWLSVFLHIFFNSIQVVVPYFYPVTTSGVNEIEAVSPYWALGSCFIFIGFLFIFIKRNSTQNINFKE